MDVSPVVLYVEQELFLGKILIGVGVVYPISVVENAPRDV